MELQSIFDLFLRTAAGVAFPAAVAVFVLTRLEGTMTRLIEEVHALREVIAQGYRRRREDLPPEP